MRFRALFPCLAVLAAALAAGCSDDPTSMEPQPEGPLAEADSIAAFWMQALADSLQAIPEGQENDYYEQIRYDDIRAGFDAALAVNSTSPVAHLGSGIMDVLELNYSPDIWALVDSLIAYDEGTTAPPGPFRADGGLYLGNGSPILRNQFSLLATAPRVYLRRVSLGIPDNLSVAHLQDVIEQDVLPALTSAVDHFVTAEAGMPQVVLALEDDSYEIDLGEVYFFHAGVHAARAAFRILTAYDWDLFGPDGTYGWIDEDRSMSRCGNHGFFEPIGGGSPYNRYVAVFYYGRKPVDAARDSLALSVLQYNLETPGSGFLTRKANDGMADAWSDLLSIRSLLEAAVASIRQEGDPQENDVIRIVDLVELDNDLATGTDKPNFAQNFTTVEDVLDWVNTIMSGPYRIQEDGPVGPIDLWVDLSAMFVSAPADWKALLPYHRFRPANTWIDDSLDGFYAFGGTPGAMYCLTDCDGMQICDTNTAELRYEYRKVSVEPLDLLNGPGGTVIDLAVEKVPYLPDYTLNGLFPAANRAKWLEIHTNAGW